DGVAVQSHPEVERVNYVHHAGNSSGIVDGAGAVLLGSKDAGAKYGLKPRAKIRAFTNIGSEPAMMLTGPVDVTEKLFERSGMKKSDIDLFMPERSNSFSVTSTGPVSIIAGSEPM